MRTIQHWIAGSETAGASRRYGPVLMAGGETKAELEAEIAAYLGQHQGHTPPPQ